MTTSSLPSRKRLPRGQREQLIIDEAIRFFAECGLDGQTRALADRMGVTQPLLYRYFSDKDSLIARVYERLYLSLWDEAWTALLQDRSRSLEERLISFYQTYYSEALTREWIRIFQFSGLRGEPIAGRYYETLQTVLFAPLCLELRHARGQDSAGPPTELELAELAGLHGAVLHLAIERWIYLQDGGLDGGERVALLVKTFVRSWLAA